MADCRDCQLPIEGYGDCAACGLSLDEYDHAPAPNRHPYQPSQWRHVIYDRAADEWVHIPGGHPATPATAEEGVR